MKLDGDKLLADLESRVKILFNGIDSGADNRSYGKISSKTAEISSIRRIARLIESGKYTIKD